MVEDCDGDDDDDEEEGAEVGWEAVDDAEGDDVLLPESALKNVSTEEGRKEERTIGRVVKVKLPPFESVDVGGRVVLESGAEVV